MGKRKVAKEIEETLLDRKDAFDWLHDPVVLRRLIIYAEIYYQLDDTPTAKEDAEKLRVLVRWLEE